MAVHLKDEYLTIPEAAEHLGVAESTIRRWIREERLPSYRLGARRILVKHDDVERLVHPAMNDSTRVGMMIETDLDRIRDRRLTPKEQARGMAALKQLERLAQEADKQRAGKPYISALRLLHEARAERTRRITAADRDHELGVNS